MGKFDKLNKELVRVNNAQGGPNAAALDDRFQLLNNTLVNTQQEWEDYVARRQQEQEALDEYSHGRGNRSYLREGMADGSYQEGMAAAKGQRTTAQKRIDKLLGVDSSQVTGEKTDWWKIAKGAWYKGADQFSTSMAGGLNWLFGDAAEQIHSLGIETINGIIGGVNSLTGSNIKPVENKGNLLTNWYETLKETKAHNEKVFAANANSSKAAQIVDNFGTSFVAAVPMALEALMTAPYAAAKAGATATTAGLQYVSGLQAAKGMEAAGMMARQSASTLMQNPQFWSSYVQAIGDSAETAEESGMSPRDAAIYTMINSFFNAVIEVGGADETLGGIQNFPMRLRQLEEQGGKKAVVEWFKDSVLGEGMEEVAQGIFERGVKAPATGAKVSSLDPGDTDAIFNPWTSAQEFTGGAVVGGLLGGGQTVIQGGVQKINDNRAFNGDAQTLLDSAKQSGGEQYAAQIREIEQAAKGKDGSVKLNRGQARQLYDIIESSGAAEQYRETVNQKATAQSAEGLVSSVFADGDIELTDQQRGRIMETMSEGSAGIADFAMGTREAYEMGERGATMEETVQAMGEKYGLTPKQARTAWGFGASENGTGTRTKARAEYGSIEEFSKTFDNPQEVKDLFEKSALTDVNEFAEGFQAAYDMGRSGVGKSYLSGSDEAGNAYVPLDGELRTVAYEMGRQNAQSTASARAEKISGSRKSGNLARTKGVVRGEGVSMADLRKTFNDRQNTAYRLLTRYAETTGVNIVLYRSQADENGQFPEAQGRFQWKDNTIYLDINSGLNGVQDAGSLGQYTMMRVFAHEFTHFIEKWNPTQYNEFREFVFATLEERGENVHDLIEDKQRLDSSGKMSYEQASREVVADGMMDILPDSRLVQQLAQEHQTIFQKLLQKMREFAARLRQHYQEYSVSAPREAEALKANSKYLDGIVKMWDEIAKGAVENYQGATGEDLFDQPGKPANLPKRNARQQRNNAKIREEIAQNEEKMPTQPETRRAGMDFFRDVEEGSEAAQDMRQQPGVQRVKPVGRERFGTNDLTSEAESGQDIRRQAGVQRVAPARRERFAANDLTSTAEEGPNLKGMVPRAAESAAEDNNVPTREDTPEGAKLREALTDSRKVTINGIEFTLTTYAGRDGNPVWHGAIHNTRGEARNGVVITNARNRLYDGDYSTRDEAVNDLVSVAENNHLLEGKERTPNVETVPEVHDGGRLPVSPAPVREGDSGVLDGTVPEDVRGVREGARKGQPVQEDSGSVSRADGAGVRPDSDRNEQAGNRRGNQGAVPVRAGEGNESGVSPEATPTLIETSDTPAAEAKQSKEDRASTILAGNFSIPEKGLGLPKGEKARFKANLEAIRIVKECQLQGREATEEEKAALSKYVGWGGLKNVFAVNDPKWAKEQKQLKSLLTEEEYEAASRSMLDAFYTEPTIVRSMYSFLAAHGVTGGTLVEPSCGTGNFIGAMPESFREGVHSITMVELDPITASIAKYLYPRADVRNSGFENTNIPENSVDVIVGNVPFGDTPIVDSRYKSDVTSKIHNYFIVRSLDLLKPGGVAMLITSSRTLNERSYGVNEAKKEMMKRADFLGAVRLPNTAFSENAGTSVVADILLFRKRAPGKPYRGEAFMEIGYERTEDGKGGFYNNEYFRKHKDMVLGTTVAGTRGMNSWTVEPKSGSLEKQIDKALSSITTDLSPVVGTMTVETIRKKVKANRQGKPRSVVKNGQIYTVDSNGNEVLNPDYVVPEGADKKSAAAIEKRKDIFTRAIGIRDIGRNLIQLQLDGADAKQIETARAQLNKAYDEFVKKYGFMNSATNRAIIWNDEDFSFILALEKYDSTTKKATKADIFSVNTVSAARPQTRANNAHEAVVLSMNTRAYLDMGYMASLLGISEEEVEKRLIDEDLAYFNNGRYEEANLYLSGDVRQKLKQAQAKAETDERYVRNVEALKKVIPKDIPADVIKVTIGAPWVPLNVYAQFLAEKINVDERKVVILYNQETKKYEVVVTEAWVPKNNELGMRTNGVFKSYSDLYGALFSGKPMQITTDGKLNVPATKAAQGIQRQIQSDFQKWLWSDSARKAELGTLYNELFNGYIEPTWSGEGITVPGLRAGIELKPHQKKAIQHAIQGGGNILLQHATGAGKTLEMESIAMLQRAMGIIQKPCFVVPNNVIDQWDASFRRDFPNAKVISTAGGAFAAQKRQAFLNKVQTGDWDAVIMTYENFKSLPVSDALHAQYVRDELAQLRSQLEQAINSRGKGMSPRDIEKKIAKKKAELEKLLASAKRQSDIETFDGLGFDALFVDEAHNLKKLAYETTFSRVMGLNDKEGNATTTDMLEKVRLLQKRNGGRGIVFATATPIMNSMVELYTFQQFLTPETLASLDLTNADNWFKQFGVLEDIQETAADGSTPKTKTAMVRYQNIPELSAMYRRFADVELHPPVGKLPTMKGGKINVIELEPTNYQRWYMSHLPELLKDDVNPMTVYMLGRNVSISRALTDKGAPVEEGEKIYSCCEEVYKEYKDKAKQKGTQIIFLDAGVPGGVYDGNLYKAIKNRLIELGVPEKEIAFIQDWDKKKDVLSDKMNSGEIRVLVGSYEKAGVGLNVQSRLSAIQLLDVPHRPGDLTQALGRGIRQGNMFDEVSVNVYVTKETFDTKSWRNVQRKSAMISSIENGSNTDREMDDSADLTTNSAEIAAIASGDTRLQRQFALNNEIQSLHALQTSWAEKRNHAAIQIGQYESQAKWTETALVGLRKDAQATQDMSGDKFTITLGGKEFKDRTNAGKFIINKRDSLLAKPEDYTEKIGSFAGFDLYIKADNTLILRGAADHISRISESPSGTMVALTNTANGMENEAKNAEYLLKNLQKAIPTLREAAVAPFDQADELTAKERELSILEQDLADNPPKLIKSDPTLDALYGGGITYVSRAERENAQAAAEAEESAAAENEESTRRQTISDREVLRMAAGEIDVEGLSEGEKDALRIFNEALDKLQEAQEQREELGRQYREQQFTKGGSRTEAAQTLARMNVLDSKVKTLENRLLSLENKDVLKRVLQKARAVVEAQEKARGKEALQKYREKRDTSEATKKYRERVRAQVMEFAKFMTSPSNKDIRKHVPAELQKSVVDFLESINLASKTALRTGGLETTKADDKYLKTMKKLKAAIKQNVDSSGLYSGFADLPEDFMENFDAMIERAEELMQRNSGEFVVNQMSAKDLKELSRVLKVLKQHIQTMNVFHNNAMFQHVDEAGESSIEHLGKFRKSRAGGTAYKFLRFDYMRPSMAFDHFGDGGRSIVKELQEGQAEQAFLANEIIGFAKKTYSGKEVKAWSEDVKTFTLSDGKEISLPVTHIMSLYCLNKRAQALTHIYGDGIRVANYKEGGKVQLDEGHIVTMDDVQKMVQSLTPRQFEVADALQKYMSTECAKWGNHVSMKRFGVEQFGEENYFPINSDGRYLPATADESPSNSGLYALLNMGFTKELKENAKNRIILYNIFDVFANHTASMTQYRAFALPVLDALRWFNYKNDATSVRDKLSMAFGAPEDARAGSGSKGYAESFVIELLRAYNGTAAQGDPYDTIGLKMLHRFNGAQIAYNLRVIIQQPAAIARAAMILSPAKLTKGLGMSITQMRKLADEMEKHSGIAAWKALGFYDTNISRGLTELIKQNPSTLDKVMDVGTTGAEQADRFTWAAMWYAAKDSVKRSEYSSEDAYWKAVTDLFEETIYKTQVVDSILTKAEFLRAKGGIARQLGSFMSEPSATMSMLADAWYKYTDDMQQGKSRSEAWQRNGGNIAKTAAVYAVSNVILAAMQAVMDAWRDDDEYDRESWLSNFLQKYAQAFKGNIIEEMLPFGKVPIVSEMYEVFKSWMDYAGVFEKLNLDLYGSDISSGLSMYLKYIDKTAKIIMDKTGISGNKSGYTNYGVIYNLVRGVSNIAGIPAAAAMREVVTLWNNTVGFFAPNKKLVTYERAVDRKKRETYRIAQEAGISQATYYALYDKADVDGDGIEQGEFGPVLMEAIKNGEITEEQAAAAWKANWNKENSTTFEKWRAKNGGETAAPEASKPQAAATKPTPTPKPQASLSDFESFKKSVSLYSDKKESAYQGWENEVKPLGVSLDSYVKIINAADAAGDGNGSVRQDEMGMQLVQKINRRELTYEQAEAIWHTIWSGARSKTFYKWYNG